MREKGKMIDWRYKLLSARLHLIDLISRGVALAGWLSQETGIITSSISILVVFRFISDRFDAIGERRKIKFNK